MPPRRKKGGMGASATSAASKKNAKPLSLAMSSDEEEHQEEEHIREVTHHVTPPEDPKHPENPNVDGPTIAKRGKKQRKDCRILDRAVEDSLVEFFRENELLWNSQKTDYRNKAKRQRILEAKATELQISVDHLWTWFKSLRDMFTRQVFTFKFWKMLQVIALTLIIMEFIYLPHTYHILIYLPYFCRMLIISTRLDKKKSGDGQQQLAERETWIKDKFGFFHRAVNHRSKPVKSLKAIIAESQGDLDKAERAAAEERDEV
ncbi:uncharacterized protein LOC128552112 [Mercenaria mercenaria]|uniref:uncharacterized protein LOC128552112 n=1 Tax=Mercenaria mercenaria TaxID=6596 RepID=UPI00234E3FFB|nr:uncharacterized protein LOC128552112 [Mercenaria mercenaria]